MRSSRGQIIEEINITPLTDIFLVLLIIMMVVAPLLNYTGVPIAFVNDKSSAQGNVSSETTGKLRLEITALGQFVLNGRAVAEGELVRAIGAGVNSGVDRIELRVHSQAPFEAMASALDVVQQTEIKSVSVSQTAM